MNVLGHFKTITHHKLLVMGYCFRVGLIRQGLLHDMSKYSLAEFRVGATHYTGKKSPNALEREEIGYSTAWLHHKGRNKHHLEYWIDYGGPDMKLMGHPMPTKYMVELCLDRIAACRVYNGKAYTDRDPLDYLDRSSDAKLLHPQTKAQVVEILSMLRDKGEKETLRYIRKVVLANPVKLYSSKAHDPADPGEKDGLFLPEATLTELAGLLPTPFYLYDAAGICRNCQLLTEAFGWNPGYRQFFPVKATPTAGILRLLREQGQGVVCSSAPELTLCEQCGFTGNEILFLPNYPREEDLKKAAELGCMPVLDARELIPAFHEAGLLRGTVGIRVTPDRLFRFGTGEARVKGVKFGVPEKKLAETVRELRDLGITSIGLHAYVTGNTLVPEYYPDLCRWLLRLRVGLELPVAYVNISGGLGLAYEPGQTPPDLPAIGKAVQDVFRQECAGSADPEPGLYTELGRFVTGPCGVLVTRVGLVKHAERNYAGVDASAADLMRPMMYGAYHHITAVGKSGTQSRSKWDVVGSVCENTDKFAEERMLPELVPGDLLVIHDAGAHGHSMGYQYGGRLRSAEYLYREAEAPLLLRRAETAEDYLRTQVF